MHRCARAFERFALKPTWTGSVRYNATRPGPLHEYNKLVHTGEIRKDLLQLKTIGLLQNLYDELASYKPPVQPQKHESWFGSMFGKEEKEPDIVIPPKGIYLYGGPGCGKTFMMDLFYKILPAEQKKRVHFHGFMVDVHKRLHQIRQSGGSEQRDPLQRVTSDLLKESYILCFDEFQVTDIADAMILKQLFSHLIMQGAVVVCTSNRPPDDLYKNGLQRSLFVPFIDFLKQKMLVHSLQDSSMDYRLLKAKHKSMHVYLSPLTQENHRTFEDDFQALAHGHKIAPIHLSVYGHQVVVPRAVISQKLAFFAFQEICGAPLGSVDYIAIGETFRTVFIADIPKMTLNDINLVRRFITLVDELYEHNVKVVLLADADATDLFEADRSDSLAPDEVFAFDRTVSRLIEMRSEQYLLSAWGAVGPEYLAQFDPHHISEQDAKNIFQNYDLGRDGSLRYDAILALLQDISALRRGHRDISDQIVASVMSTMGQTGKTGAINEASFVRFMTKFGLVMWNEAGDV